MPVAAATGATPAPTESVQVAAIGWTGCGETIEGLSPPRTASAACAARGEAGAQSRASAITVTPTLRNTLVSTLSSLRVTASSSVNAHEFSDVMLGGRVVTGQHNGSLGRNDDRSSPDLHYPQPAPQNRPHDIPPRRLPRGARRPPPP